MSDRAQMGHSVGMEQGFMLVGVPNSDYIVHHGVKKSQKNVQNATGMVLCYRQILGTWIKVDEINAPKSGISNYAKFGSSIDISVGIGNTNLTVAIIGAPGINTAYVFQWLWNDASHQKGKWHLEEELTHPDASRKDHMFAAPGAVAIDHHWAIVGASGSERVFVWKRNEINPIDNTHHHPFDYKLYGSNRTGINGTQPAGAWVLWQVLEASTRHQVSFSLFVLFLFCFLPEYLNI